MSRLSPLCILLAATAALLPGRAAEPTTVRVARLTLESAIQHALERNFAVEIQRIEPMIAKEGVTIQQGRFDPVWDITAERSDTSRRDVFRDGISLQNRNRSRVDNLSSGISGVTSWGTRYDLGYGTRGNTGSDSLLGDLYDTSGSIGLTQPLLRGAGPAANLALLRIARSNVRISEWQLRQRVIDTIRTIDFVYNDLYSAIEDAEVAVRSRELARQLLQDNEARVKIGVKSPLDVTEARARVAAREEAVIVADRKRLDNENLLKQLVSSDLLAILDVRVEIEPPGQPEYRPNVRGSIADALALRPDYRQGLLDLEQRHITVALQKNQLLPRIDLTGSIALLGLDDDFGGSFGRIGRRDRTEWSAGVIFSIPLGNRTARGSYNQAKLEAAKQIMILNELEQRVIVEVDNASGQIVSSRQRIISNVEATRLAKESLNAGEEKLRAGTGTTFEVLELQEKLAQAESAEILAKTQYNQALGEFYRVTGTSLRVYGVAVE